MRRRILLSFVLLLVIFGVAAAISSTFIRKSTEKLNHLITLHEIEGMRQQLVYAEQAVRSDFSAVASAENRERLGEFIGQVQELQDAAHSCQGCHHQPVIAQSLEEVVTLVDAYVVSMSDYITASPGSAVHPGLENGVRVSGERLFQVTETMARQAREQLEARTLNILNNEAKVRWLLLGSLTLALLLGGAVAYRLTTAVTRPVESLLQATRRVRAGEMDFELTKPDTNEFGELALNFNEMTRSLKESYQKLEHEMSEHRDTASALRQSEGFLRTVFDSIQDPFLVFDRDRKIVRVNEAYIRLTGSPAEELMGRDSQEVFGISDREECVVASALDTAEPSVRVVKFATEGSEAWHEAYTYPIHNEAGEVSHAISYSRDITDRKRAELEVIAINERFELAAAGANDGLWDWQVSDGKFVVSPRWRSLLGLESDVVVQVETWLDRIHPSDQDRVRRSLNVHLEGEGRHFREEHRIQRHNGDWLWVLARGLAVRDSDGLAYRMAGSLTDISQRKAFEEKLIYNAVHDPLTGLPNRPLMRDRLRQAEARAARNDTYKFAVLFLDLDRFKVVNDTLGHLVGDKVLTAVARRLQECLRDNDSVGRLGGDEFVIMLDAIEDTSEAVACARRIQEALREPIRVGKEKLHVAVSIGIAPNSIEHERPEDLLRFADIAMYQVKSRRRGDVQVYQEGKHIETIASLDLEVGLHHALERGELKVVYQPIISVADKKTVGLEALVRWQHPERGLVEPEEFLHLAEHSGQIVDIGSWVLSETVGQLGSFLREFPEAAPLFMSVNVSMRQLQDEKFVAEVAGLLERSNIDPSNLQLELTETVLAYDPDAIVEVLASLRALGLGICLDDFGTGYSSLGYLDRFPITSLKIDSSFIRQMNNGHKTPEIIRTIVSLAKSLSLDVVAEGIEQPFQLAALEELGCEFAQGFHIARPAGVVVMKKWFSEERDSRNKRT